MLSALLVVGAALVAPAHGTTAPSSHPAAPRVVHVIAHDFAFQAPDTIESGAVTFHLMNQGTQLHHMWLVRLTGGHTLADFNKAMSGPEAPLPAWAAPVGGPNPAAPGQNVSASMVVTPGNYVMLCVIPGPDNVPHVMKGMERALTVVPANGDASTELPKADVDVTLKDYAFAFSKPLTAGHHVLRVTVDAAQPHELVMIHLAPGKTVNDMLAWVEKQQGPPPGAPVGGAAPLAKGDVNVVPVDLAPGNYALICFVPDAKDGKPHFMHGMTQQITVQ